MTAKTQFRLGKSGLQASAVVALSALVGCIGGGEGLSNADVVHPLMIDNEATIAARRVSYGKPILNTVIELKKTLKAAPNGIALGSQMVFNEAQTPKTFAMRPQSKSNGALYSDSLTYTSTDSSIVSANGGVLQATGKLGNAYITASNASGQPVERFMFLTAAPKQRVLTINSITQPELNDAFVGVTAAGQPQCNRGGTSCSYPYGTIKPYFSTSGDGIFFSDPTVTDLLADDTSGFERVIIFKNDATALKFRRMVSDSDFPDAQTKYDAVYFSDYKLLMKARPLGGYRGSPTNSFAANRNIPGGASGVSVGGLVSQKDFDNYYDYGNQLVTSRIPNSRDLNSLSISLPGQLKPKALSAVRYADGSSLGASAFRTMGLSAKKPVSYEYEYEYVTPAGAQIRTQEDSDDDDGSVTEYIPRCSFDVEGITPTFTGLGGELQLNFDGAFKWTDSGVDFNLEVNPLGFMGYTELDLEGEGKVKWECKMFLVKIPFEEVTLPVLGQVDLSVPVYASIRGEIAQNSGGPGAKVAGPFLAVGSQTDANKQGRIAVGLKDGSFYGPGFGAGNNYDLGLYFNLIPQLMRGTPAGAVVEKSSFVGPSFELEAEGEVEWRGRKLFDFTITALDAALGIRTVSTDTVDASGAKADSRQRSNNISFLATVDAQVSIKVFWFTKSIELFSVEVPPVDLFTSPLPDQLGVDLLPSLQTKDAFNGFGDSSLSIGQITDGPISSTLKNWDRLGRNILRLWLESDDGRRISDVVAGPGGGDVRNVTFQKITKTTGKYRIMADYRRDETSSTIPLSTMMDFGY
jgi:hypothetical protein